ncbi:metal-dependent transcriptional regulator [Candidatus Hecatella orcuttiae]|uniref:metal-dependent transcriptional regulator n=1 Tax=Candidatus Hecatella orcuttiae TaxID=1935119 RepID=UPI0028681A06|nr:metal-dependent transcriptional regulator [Candidatus Hecatella orcuttiae]
MSGQQLSESIEDYLEALWISEEEGASLAKISWIARHLDVSSPSVVEMLKKLEKQGLVVYEPRDGVRLTETGKKKAEQIIRSHRLAELLLTDILKMKLDMKTACGLEHHLSEDVADAVCTYLNHPRLCPHGNKIPKGNCCP